MRVLYADNNSFSPRPHDEASIAPLGLPPKQYDQLMSRVTSLRHSSDDRAISGEADVDMLARELQNYGLTGHESYTVNHDVIMHWMDQRNGFPARVDEGHVLKGKAVLYIYFEDVQPDFDIQLLTWEKFFRLFERNKKTFVFSNLESTDASDRFYRFIDRRIISRLGHVLEQY